MIGKGKKIIFKGVRATKGFFEDLKQLAASYPEEMQNSKAAFLGAAYCTPRVHSLSLNSNQYWYSKIAHIESFIKFQKIEACSQ